MANKFADLRAMLSPESRVRSEAIAKRMLAEMSLNELRQIRTECCDHPIEDTETARTTADRALQ